MLLTRDAAASYTAFIDGGAARDCGGRGWFFSGFPERIDDLARWLGRFWVRGVVARAAAALFDN
jgi:hypothetical protein